ncbi:unnamed protein product [Rhizophagus irregularis]|uniref:Uncharacterized protein n=1 Tax=Rhizophagus irregularis TaxID=588596 RepID=A0A2I1FX43_9GLOM|nr:hypothetical protein RhiirA4_452057 [Rhizophagus irregularis]CAB4409194.1 unnamed protein product [Rhizophagus irregularis]
MLQCLFQGPCSQNSAAVQNTVECLSESLQPGSLGTSETSSWIRLTRDPLRKGNFNDISKTIEDLSEEIGEEFAKKLSSVRDINPGMWTPTLENYIDTVLE